MWEGNSPFLETMTICSSKNKSEGFCGARTFVLCHQLKETNMFLKTAPVIAALLFLPVAAHANPGHSAQAVKGSWSFVPSACPDLVEDRRDARITTSRRDAREDKRDARTVTCPASAWQFQPANGFSQSRYQPAYAGPRVVHVSNRGAYSFERRRAAPRPVKSPSINIIIR